MQRTKRADDLQLLWNRRLASEGLGEIDFAQGLMTSSAASYHQERTLPDRQHTRDASSLSQLATVLADQKLPSAHRLVLSRYVSGASLRVSAESVGISKDTAHRIVLRYMGHWDRATMRELAPREATPAIDPRRADPALRCRRRDDAAEPQSHSETADAYFKLAQEFLEQELALTAPDGHELYVWTLHAAGQSRREIARRLKRPHDSIRRTIDRCRTQFKAWLRASIDTREQDQREEILELFAEYENPKEI